MLRFFIPLSVPHMTHFLWHGARILILIMVTWLLYAAPGVVSAEDDTELARGVYSEVNKRLKTYRMLSTSAKRPDVEYTSSLKAWFDGDTLKKIQVTDLDDSGSVITEYYYADGGLIFVYQAIMGFNDTGKQVTTIEERQYFREGRMFRWLSGIEKALNDPGTPEFKEEGKSRLTTSAFYMQVVMKLIQPQSTKK